MSKIYELIVTALVAVPTFLFGGWDGLVIALIAFIAIDYATGVAVAAVQKRLSSEIGAKGIAKKIIMLLIVALGHILDVYIVKTGDTVRDLATVFYLANEGISILENAAVLGLPVPQKIADILVQIEARNQKTEGRTEDR
jgi:toxin secretion/phage lysis holin